jgi:hypothetical protein
MHDAFEKGYDPVLELEAASRASSASLSLRQAEAEGQHVRRPEQGLIDSIINGEQSGHYYLLLGPKGTGKTSMIVEAMAKNEADGVAMCEAHEHPEVFRLRIGKCLNFEYLFALLKHLASEKTLRERQGGLVRRPFSAQRASRRWTAARYRTRLEQARKGETVLFVSYPRRLSSSSELQVAIRFRKDRGRPLCLVFNNIHFLRDDETGHEILHQLQQRAESWAQAGVLTMV